MRKKPLDTGRYAGDLFEAKPVLGKLAETFNTTNMTECLRQIILQLDREAKRTGADSLSYGDITIRKRQ